MIKPYVNNIEDQTIENDNFRHVVFTGEHLQLVLMSLNAGEDIGKETHPHTDQFIRVEQGTGIALIGGEEFEISDGFAVTIPAGTEHNITNTGDVPLRIYTVYSSVEHPDGIVEKTKKDAEEMEPE